MLIRFKTLQGAEHLNYFINMLTGGRYKRTSSYRTIGQEITPHMGSQKHRFVDYTSANDANINTGSSQTQRI